MIDKKDMTEEEIKLNYITPAITDKWPKSSIRMEYYFTSGRIIIDGKKSKRDKGNKADYLLYHGDVSSNFPIAVVEAKDNNHSPLGGLPQAMKYALAMKLQFAFASNGDSFSMHDMLSGTEITDIALEDFPSPEELWQKYRQESGFTEEEEAMLAVPYHYREGEHEPRYYQWIAVNRVLFLADRDILVSQPMRDDFSPLGGKMFRIEKREMDTTHEVYLSLYHQMKKGEVNYYTAYDRDFFDLVIVDAHDIIGQVQRRPILKAS